jgi:uncharacterized membrane protein YtjA (UPF0391 family)
MKNRGGHLNIKTQVYGRSEIMTVDLLYIGIVLLIIGIVFYALGARGLGGFTAGVGKTLLWVFVILFVITLLLRMV